MSNIVDSLILKSMDAYTYNKQNIELSVTLDLDSIKKIENIPENKTEIIKCSRCCCHLNPFCEIFENPSRWRCSVCKSVQFLKIVPSYSVYNSNAFFAKNTVQYLNHIFEYTSESTKNVPVVCLCLQSSINHDIIDILKNEIEYINDDVKYILILVDSLIKIYNFKYSILNVICTCLHENDTFLCSPHNHYYGDYKSLVNALSVIKSNEVNDQLCNLNNVFSLLKIFPCYKMMNCIFFIKNISSNPIINNDFSVILFYFSNSISLLNLRDTLELQNSKLILVDDIGIEVNLLKFIRNIKKEVSYSHVNPTVFHIATYDSRIKNFRNKCFTYIVGIPDSSCMDNFMINQVIINYYSSDGYKKSKVLTFRIPLLPDKIVNHDIVFRNKFYCVYSMTKYVINAVYFLMNDMNMFDLRSQILEIGRRYQLKDIWPKLIYSMITSDLFSTNHDRNQRTFQLLYLKGCQPALSFLYFVELELVDDSIQLVFGGKNKNATVRLTHNAIYVLDTVKDKENEIHKALELSNISSLDIPTIIVKNFPKFNNIEEKYEEWFKSYNTFVQSSS